MMGNGCQLAIRLRGERDFLPGIRPVAVAGEGLPPRVGKPDRPL